MISEVISKSHKIVIKLGSSTVTKQDGSVDMEFLEGLAKQVKTLMSMGKQVVLVSSGATVAGVYTLGRWARKDDIHYKQALCAIGQVEVMESYKKIFLGHDLHIAQILLTKGDIEDDNRSLNIRNTLFTLIDEGVVPIINENDTVCVEEIKIGDNDMLSAHSTVLWGGDLLIILSDIEGIYNKSPKDHKDAYLIEEVRDIEKFEKNISIGEKSNFGTGGIVTKIKAAKRVTGFGIPMIVAKGKKENIVLGLAEGEERGTLFLPEEMW